MKIIEWRRCRYLSAKGLSSNFASNIKDTLKAHWHIQSFFLGRPVHTLNPRRRHRLAQSEKVPKFVPPDILNVHSLALSVLRILCKTFSKLLNLALRKTLFHGRFLKNSHIQIKFFMAISLCELRSSLTLKDAASSTEGITLSSVNCLRKRRSDY